MPGILFIDTETTGIPKFDRPHSARGQPYIVQLAAILTDDAGQVGAEFCVVIRPRRWKIPEEAQRIHGISTERARAEGIPIAEALDKLDQLMAQSDAIVAHNIEFDLFLLHSEYERAERTAPFTSHTKRCTMKETTHLVGLPNRRRPGQFKWPSLTEAHRFFVGKNNVGAHDALADARACAAIYFACRDKMTLDPPCAHAEPAPSAAIASIASMPAENVGLSVPTSMMTPSQSTARAKGVQAWKAPLLPHRSKTVILGISAVAIWGILGAMIWRMCNQFQTEPPIQTAAAVTPQVVATAVGALGVDASSRVVAPKLEKRKAGKSVSDGGKRVTQLPPSDAAPSPLAPDTMPAATGAPSPAALRE